MKTVFSNHSEVCHVWASQAQETGKAGNISFKGTEILSYHWWIMAKFIIGTNVILARNWSYSNSTSKHLTRVHGAIPGHYEVIYCENPDGYSHRSNIENYVQRINSYASAFKTARTYKQRIFNENQCEISQLKRYCEIFNVQCPSGYIDLNTTYNLGLIESAKVRAEELEKIRTEKFEQLRQSIASEVEKLENNWIEGITNETYISLRKKGRYYDNFGFSQTRLRIKNEQVETSRGAKVPIESAKILWRMIQAGRDVKGYQVGYYTVISLNGVLKIGCHEITREEIKRFTEKYQW